MANHKKTEAKGNGNTRDGGVSGSSAWAKSSMGGPAQPNTTSRRRSIKESARSGEPSSDTASEAGALAAKMVGTDELARQFPHNANKPSEYDSEGAVTPPEGVAAKPSDPSVLGSTLSETVTSPKVGSKAPPSTNPANAPLDRVRVDSSDQTLTTNQGVQVPQNQDSLKIGARGPSLLEDFILREKITHFDHERIPERVVHARGSAAHGYFECTAPIPQYTRAAPFAEAGKRTPVFVRFSTVAGERGSADTVRDVRGFATKFYTDEGIWDLVGNNIPVFFIQDAMKFPDLIHAVKPEQHHAMPQASSAHDTFWDFVTLMPESTHMLMWHMSDRAIPRSYRTMQGFGVHTFRLVNADGDTVLCKFHWVPVAGTHSLVWDEAVKIAGADPDFHRRDLWEAIEAGAYPEYELNLQIFSEEQAEEFSFDVLDATKIVPEELAPLIPVGRMVLNRNPDNFFAETEQVAFCASHVVPGIDFTNDPLLQGRLFSYLDTQLLRLGGPNFHEIPINTPIAQVHNNQRDGFHRQAIPRGRVAYEPNSLAGGCPFQAGARGFVSFPRSETGDKLRVRPERFAEHYAQATLFWRSQSPIEQQHIINAYSFELTRVQTPAIRERMVSMLVNVDEGLAAAVAAKLGMAVPPAQPRAAAEIRTPEVEVSPPLSLMARPGKGIVARRIAILVDEGVRGAATVHDALAAAGAVPRYLGSTLGTVTSAEGEELPIDITLEASPSVLYDAIVVPDGEDAAVKWAKNGHACDFVKDAYRHCKPILGLGTAAQLLDINGISATLPNGEEDRGIIIAEISDTRQAVAGLVDAIERHRFFPRETDPPLV